jgi:rhodanese-related sulfurtransferase
MMVGLVIFASGLASALGSQPKTSRDVNWRLDPSRSELTLDDVERDVVTRYRVPDMSIRRLEAALAANAVTLFDVRTAVEYEAGHIPGAIHIDPETTAAAFLALHRERLKERPAVFYCAVGVRSSRMMDRLLRDIAPSSAASVHNLRSGLFRWVAEGRELVAGAEPGELHPFDDNWNQLLQRTLAAG